MIDRPRLLATAVCTALLLAACEARFGEDAGEVAGNASAAGRAEDGRLTVEAPGLNLSIDLPEGIRSRTQMEEDNALIYPGATFGGIHVQGGREGPDGEHDGEVELRFTTADALDRVVAWYRDPARGQELRIESAGRQGDGFLMTGTDGDGDPFRLSLTGTGAGTEARLLLGDRHR